MAKPIDAVDVIIGQWRRERPDLDPASMGIVGRISRNAELLQRELDRVFALHGLSGGEFDVLATLRRSGGATRLTPGDLSELTMLTSGGMTKRLDRLEARGLVRREPDPRDRRGKLIVLTDEGRALVDEAVEAHLENEHRLLATLTATDRQRLAELLRTLLIELDGERDPGPATS